MRLAVGALLITLIWLGSACSENELDGYQILTPGKHHGADVSVPDVEGWYGLFRTDSGHVLEPVEIQARPWHDSMLDGPGDTTGIRISVDHQLTPLFLIQSPDKLEPGIVTTYFEGNKFVYPGELIRLEGYVLTALGKLSDEEGRPPTEPLILDYQVKLYNSPNYGGSRQVLVEHGRAGAEDTPSLIWAGDLDRDGKLDLFMDIANHYAPRHYALYLSSEAEGDDLVKLVAELFLRGC